ncbi:tetratricopeptide repeat protein [Candidatus Poribacteria bacterium]|nr:tetratricopeptide repeat protein [Candidatus Poribacteria bacterium]
MNRLLSYSACVALAILATMIIGCSGALSPLSVKIQSAEIALEQANGFRIQSDDPEKRKKEKAKREKLYDRAMKNYNTIIERSPDGKYAQRAHFGLAAIHQRHGRWDEATTHYQAIVDLSPTGYLGGKARSGIADIRKNRQIIRNDLRVYRNRLETEDSQNKAAEALINVAKAYESLANYGETIRYYEKMADEFPNHKKAPQSQYNVGRIYFYELYDYSNSGGWGAYNKVIENFPEAFEANQAATLLKETKEILDEIRFDQEDIKKYTSKKAIEYENAGRVILASERYLMGQADRIVQDFQSIARGWEKLRNYPYALASYRKLAENLSYKKFASADARYQIGRLYQQDGQYQRAIEAYEDLFKNSPESTWRNEAVYQQAVCFRAIREFSLAHRAFKAYMSINKGPTPYSREAEQIVRQMELDQDGDGHMLYKEQEAGTSDQDPNDYPGATMTETLGDVQ